MVTKVTQSVFGVGVNDRRDMLFEAQYRIPQGISYNSYVIMDEKVAVLDTVDAEFGDEWLGNVREALGGRQPDFLVVHHAECDHSANIARFLGEFPAARLVLSAQALTMVRQFFDADYSARAMVVKEGVTLPLGVHTLRFVAAPLVHWPEVLFSYEEAEKLLFSADAFGKFGAANADDGWDDEARRYYIGIVGKFGAQVQNVLKKVSALDVRAICPLHGPVLQGDLSHYVGLYDTWSSYRAESDGVLVAYTSVYGHTAQAAQTLAGRLRQAGRAVDVLNLSDCDMAQAVALAFKHGTLVLATTTYNGSVFPFMADFLSRLTEHNFCNRTVGIVENGSWAPVAAKAIKERLGGAKGITFVEPVVTIRSALNAASTEQLGLLADALAGGAGRA